MLRLDPLEPREVPAIVTAASIAFAPIVVR